MSKKEEIIGLLLEKKLVTEQQVEKINDEIARTGLKVEKAIEKLGIASEEKIAKIRADALGVHYMDLNDYVVDQKLANLIPEDLAKKYKVVPLFKVGDSVTVAMANPKDIAALDKIRKVSNIDNIEPLLASEKSLHKTIDSVYGVSGSVENIVSSIDKDKLSGQEEKDLTEIAGEAPVVKLVNTVITKAIKDRASDIHIEPAEKVLRVRNRIDGVLHEAYSLPKGLHKVVASRVKLLAAMDIAESRRPQDGRIRLKIENNELDIRVSTFPTVYGENIVMRLLDKSSVILGLEEIGFSKENLNKFNELIKRPNGIILVTGPTGSGKTTTLYSALTTMNTVEKNIITIEDPVEYELPLIRQTQVNPKAGITFANGLKAILRQDPDIIMVGEIRDKETADIAIHAALTGHLVLSTLHTNDAASALTRLIDMGIEPFLVASSVIGILAQRLVRLVCPKCRQEQTIEQSLAKELGLDKKIKYYKGKGCPACKGIGLVGRTGLFELLLVDQEIRNMVNDKKSSSQIRQKAVDSGMQTLRENGIEKIKAGISNPEEVLKVIKEG